MDNVIVKLEKREKDALEKLAAEMGVSESRVFVHALRFFQLCRYRGYDKMIHKLEQQHLPKRRID